MTLGKWQRPKLELPASILRIITSVYSLWDKKIHTQKCRVGLIVIKPGQEPILESLIYSIDNKC